MELILLTYQVASCAVNDRYLITYVPKKIRQSMRSLWILCLRFCNFAQSNVLTVNFWSGFAIPQTVQCYVSFRRVADDSSTWSRPNSQVSFAVFCGCCIHIGDDYK